MYNPATIKTGLFGLLGWRQNYNTSDYTIASSLTNSSSGMYFQDVHPLLTLDNVKAVTQDFTKVTHPTWLIGTQYYKDNRVTLSGTNYKAKRDNAGQSPDSSPDDWETYDEFSEWLENKTKGSILKAVSTLWDEQMVEHKAKNLLESKALFDGAGRFSDTIATSNHKMGFELVVARAKGVVVKIDKIGTQFSAAASLAFL